LIRSGGLSKFCALTLKQIAGGVVDRSRIQSRFWATQLETMKKQDASWTPQPHPAKYDAWLSLSYRASLVSGTGRLITSRAPDMWALFH
jgi:hypothetical protein